MLIIILVVCIMCIYIYIYIYIEREREIIARRCSPSLPPKGRRPLRGDPKNDTIMMI